LLPPQKIQLRVTAAAIVVAPIPTMAPVDNPVFSAVAVSELDDAFGVEFTLDVAGVTTGSLEFDTPDITLELDALGVTLELDRPDVITGSFALDDTFSVEFTLDVPGITLELDAPVVTLELEMPDVITGSFELDTSGIALELVFGVTLELDTFGVEFTLDVAGVTTDSLELDTPGITLELVSVVTLELDMPDVITGSFELDDTFGVEFTLDVAGVTTGSPDETELSVIFVSELDAVLFCSEFKSELELDASDVFSVGFFPFFDL
jgi:hypothetical protein